MMLFPSGKVELDFYRLYNENFHIDDPLLNYLGQVCFLYLMTCSEPDKIQKNFLYPALRNHLGSNLLLFERKAEQQRKSPDIALLDSRCRLNLLENFRKSYINRTGHFITQPVEITRLISKLLPHTEGMCIYNPHAGTGCIEKELEGSDVIAVEENAVLQTVFMIEDLLMDRKPLTALKRPDSDMMYLADDAQLLVSTLSDPLFWNDANACRHFFDQLAYKCKLRPQFKAYLLVPDTFLVEERYRLFRNSLLPYVMLEMLLPNEVMYLTGRGMALLIISGRADKHTFDFVDARSCIKIAADRIVLDVQKVGELMPDASAKDKFPADRKNPLSPPGRSKYYNGQAVPLSQILARIDPFGVDIQNLRRGKVYVMSMDMSSGGLHQDSITAGIPESYKAIDRPAILISRYLGNGLNVSAYQEDERGIIFFAEDLILAYSFDEENWDSGYLVREISKLGSGKKGEIILDERELLTTSITYRPLEEQRKSSDAGPAAAVSENRPANLRRQEEENCQIAFRNITDAFTNYDQYASLLVEEALSCPELEQTARELSGHMEFFRNSFAYYMTHVVFSPAETLDEKQVEKIVSGSESNGHVLMNFVSSDPKERQIDGTVSRTSCLSVASRDLLSLVEAVRCLAEESGKVNVLYGHGPDERHLTLEFRYEHPSGKPALKTENLLKTSYGWYIKRFTEHYDGSYALRNEGKETDIIIVLPIRFE